MAPRPRSGDLSGAVADLGIFVPLSAALVLVNGLDVGSVLLAAGRAVSLPLGIAAVNGQDASEGRLVRCGPAATPDPRRVDQ